MIAAARPRPVRYPSAEGGSAWTGRTAPSRPRSAARCAASSRSVCPPTTANGPPARPDEWVADRTSGDPDRLGAAREWAAALGERGWVAPHIPPEYGGGGLSKWEQFIYTQEMARAGAPIVGSSHSVEMLTPTLVVHGSDQQKRAYLPRILAGDMIWCQGYSEPGAGSDLAALQTRAVLDGDEYVVNGQKIWTTNGHHADAIFALVRTDPDAPKHRGISFC